MADASDTDAGTVCGTWPPCTSEPGSSLLSHAENSPPAASLRKQGKTTGLCLRNDASLLFQEISDSVQTLQQKMAVLRTKLSKIECCTQMVSVWADDKSLGFPYRVYTPRSQYHHPAPKRKGRLGYSNCHCHDPTLLVEDEDDLEAPPVATSSFALGAPHQKQMPTLWQKIPRPHREIGVTPNAAFPSSSTSCRPSFLSTGKSGNFKSAQVSAASAKIMLSPTEQPQTHHLHPELMTEPTSLRLKNPNQQVSPFVSELNVWNGRHQGIRKPTSSDPSTWSVNKVILFLKQNFSENVDPLAHHFRQHEIDGKALLLLSIDNMVKYMDIDLDTAQKVYVLIERLRMKRNTS